jgi:hypothetical protein
VADVDLEAGLEDRKRARRFSNSRKLKDRFSWRACLAHRLLENKYRIISASKKSHHLLLPWKTDGEDRLGEALPVAKAGNRHTVNRQPKGGESRKSKLHG